MACDENFPGQLFGETLQRNVAPEVEVLGFIDHAHSATAQPPQHAILGNGIAITNTPGSPMRDARPGCDSKSMEAAEILVTTRRSRMHCAVLHI